MITKVLPKSIAIAFFTDNQVNKNNINFRYKNNIPVFSKDIEEYPTWLIPFDSNVQWLNTDPLIFNQVYKAIDNTKVLYEYIENIYYIDLNMGKPIIEYIKSKYPNINFISDFKLDKSEYIDKQIDGIARIATHTGCKFNCNFCSKIDKSVNVNPDFQWQLDYIKKNYYPNNWIYLDNKTYGQTPEERNVVSELRDFNLIVQTRCDIPNHMEYHIFKDTFILPQIKYIELGVESFNSIILRKLNKYGDNSVIYDTIHKFNRFNKNVIINLLFNTPYHKLSDYQYEYDCLKELIESKRIVYFNLNIMADYNSKNPLDWNQNNIIKSWNNTYELAELEVWYNKFVNLQKSLTV